MKHKRFLILLVLVAVCIAAVVMRNGPLPQLAPPELLPLSKEVGRIPSRQTYYAWQSNDSFVQFETYPHPAIMQVDVRTGGESNLMSLQRWFGTQIPYTIVLSPNGQNAIGEENQDQAHGFCSTSLESSSDLSRTRLSDKFEATASNPVWMPDSKHWIALMDAAKGISAVVCEDGKAKAVEEIKIGIPDSASRGYDLERTHLLGVTQAGRVLATPDGTDGFLNLQDSRRIHFWLIDK